MGLLSGAAVVIAIIGGGWQIAGVTRHRRRVHARHTELAWLLTGGTAPQAGRVLWLPTSEPPHAYSLTGSPPLVVMSRGLRDCLDQAAVRAIRSHEDAHLQRRHHWFIAVAQALSAGIAWLPLTRQSPALVRMLIELDADAHAARIHGHRPLRRAIQTLRYAPRTRSFAWNRVGKRTIAAGAAVGDIFLRNVAWIPIGGAWHCFARSDGDRIGGIGARCRPGFVRTVSTHLRSISEGYA